MILNPKNINHPDNISAKNHQPRTIQRRRIKIDIRIRRWNPRTKTKTQHHDDDADDPAEARFLSENMSIDSESSGPEDSRKQEAEED